ncbi:brachyurin [Lepeophtheirus salmonis]|uniref:brachyurin n=1 Tax=Lepeophtheirus salmonis TaxID=72036 RepID=UPI001AE2705E|nr:brachyurin-like [Lepeophtheirus salmonis]
MRTLVFVALIVSTLANPKYPDTCGIENKPSVDSRIIGGQEAVRSQFPWLAAVFTHGECTGSILDENWIITAKHCIDLNGVARVRVGAHSKYGSIIDEKNMQIRESSHFNVSSKGDFALIKLNSSLILNRFVRPVCLPTRANVSSSFIGSKATITGWGVNSFDRANYAELYFAKNVSIIQCNQGKDIICTDANHGKAVCFGDSGGPLNYEMENGRYMQIGVNQFVTNWKCVGGINGFARVSSHLDFIQEVTGIVIE